MSEDFGSGGGDWGGGGGYSETSYQSWFSRLGNAIVGVLFGLVLILVAFVLLFWNEGRAVDRARALEEAGSNVLSVTSAKVEPANDAKLVHVVGNAETTDTPADDLFGVQAKGMIQLARKVEMYQWKENVRQETQKQIGGGTKTIKHYTYEKHWSEHPVSSDGFKEPGHHNPPWPAGLASRSFTAGRVTLGAFILPSSLVAKIGNPQPLSVSEEDAKKLPDAAKKEYRVQAGDFFKGQGSRAEPQIGDLKVAFSIVKPRQVSVIAEQSQGSFRAYQPKSASSPIEELRDGNLSAKEMIAKAADENTVLTWLLRGVGFVLMAIGIFLLFNPFVVFADVLPFLGSFASAVLAIVAMLASCMLSLVTIAVGWIAYRPLIAIPVLLVAGLGAVGTVVGLIRVGSRKPGAPPERARKKQ